MKLKDIAVIVDAEIVGDSELEITGVSGISDAKEGDITFISSSKWISELNKSRADAVIVSEHIKGVNKSQLITKNPQFAFAKLLSYFYVKPHPYKGISEKAFVSDEALIDKDVTVYPFAHISDGVRIGSGTVIHSGVFIGKDSIIRDNCVIYPNVVIREGIVIGSRVIVHAGTVIGSDGFGYVFHEGIHHKIPQVGGVVIEDDVEIGSNVTIDRATTGNTFIGKGTKIDNLVQIGHNVRIGKNVILVAQVAIGGSSVIGDGVIIGGQVGISDHSIIEAGTMIGAKSGVMGEVKRGIYSGVPAIAHRDWLKASALFARLPYLSKKIKEIEEEITDLKSKI